MATFATSLALESRLNALRCALTGAAVVMVLFALCWAAAAVGLVSGSHMYVSLFAAALSIGRCWSAVFGALTGALAYNAFGVVARR